MWPEAAETSEILLRAREGDADAASRLLGRHREALRRMVDRRLDPAIRVRLDASDVVQEVLLEAHRRLKDYLKDPALPFHLWLRLIARDHIISAHRRHRAAAKRSVERERPLAVSAAGDRSSIELASFLRDAEPTPAAAAIQAELNRRFQEAIEKLAEDDREIILMRHFEDLSNQDAARALGLSQPAAGMRYLRALRRLRALLAGDGSEAPSR